MLNRPDFNVPAFEQARRQLEREGWDVISQLELARWFVANDLSKLDRGKWLKECVERLAQCDAIGVLPEWRDSREAMQFMQVARILELDIYDANTFLKLHNLSL